MLMRVYTVVFIFLSAIESTSTMENASNASSTSGHLEMKQHGLLNRKSNITININEHRRVQESEDNTDIIHNLGTLVGIMCGLLTWEVF